MLNSCMRFILGAPCSGKGTITSNLKEFKSISAGNLLRELCETEKYSYLKKTLSEGGLVATDLICEILIEEAKKYHYDVFIDGFPRTLDQAIVTKKFLLDNNIQMKGVFYIIANDSLLIERTLTRTYCNACFLTDNKPEICCNKDMIRRADDNIQTLLKRLKIFNDNIEDILRIMGGPIYFINNENDIKDTIQNIRKFL